MSYMRQAQVTTATKRSCEKLMNLIQREYKSAASKMLDMIPGTDLVRLSPDNVAIVEAMIRNDSAYLKSSDKNAAPIGQYGGSTAYWMTRLKPILVGEEVVSDKEYQEVLFGAIAAVDRENSTHLNSDGVGRAEIFGRLLKIDKSQLVNYLREPGDDLVLAKIIAEETHPTGMSKNGTPYYPRKNISFASKFCHYACFYLFEGQPEQDNYSIFDNVLREVLPKYIAHYSIEKRNIDDYSEYRKTVDDIIENADAPISRNGFDHLLWYYFKGRI